MVYNLGVNLLERPLLGRLRCCVNPHLNAPDPQTAKMSAFIEVLTLAYDQLMK